MVQVYCSRFPFTTMFSTQANELQSVAGLLFRSHNSGVYSQKSASFLYPLHCWCPRQEHDLSAVITSVLSTNVERDCTCFPWLCFVPQLYLFFVHLFYVCLSLLVSHVLRCLRCKDRATFVFVCASGHSWGVPQNRPSLSPCTILTYILHAASNCLVIVFITSVFFVYGDLVAFACR